MVIDVRPLTEADREPALRLLAEGIHGSPSDNARRMEAPVDAAWLAGRWGVEDTGRLVGTARVIPFAHFLGGRPVPCAGVAGVAIAADARSRGVGLQLMTSVLEQQHADGVALSSLYFTSMAPYRRVGYELAGSRVRYRAGISTLPRLSDLRVEPWDDSALGEVRACYQAYARTTSGLLDRPDTWWEQRILAPAGDEFVYRYLVRRDGEVRGYVVFTMASEPGDHLPDHWLPGRGMTYALATRDLIWLDRDAGEQLLGLAATNWQVGTHLYWTGPPEDPLRTLLRDRPPVVDNVYAWMARVVHVSAALEARGYPPGLSTSVELAVEDPVLPANTGSYRLSVAEGDGRVERIPSATATVTVNGLAALFTGSLPARDAVRLGVLRDASEPTVTALEAVFAGPSPWLVDFF